MPVGILGASALLALNIAGADAGSADRSFTLQELARHDGEDGHQCLVAVDGEVYLIEGFDLWKDGEHTPSGGRARCGLDLTEVMDEESPHGRSRVIATLDLLAGA